MAIGDRASEAGLPLTTGSELANTIDTEINRTRDYVGDIILNNPPRFRVGTTLPGTTGNIVGEVFVRYN